MTHKQILVEKYNSALARLSPPMNEIELELDEFFKQVNGFNVDYVNNSLMPDDIRYVKSLQFEEKHDLILRMARQIRNSGNSSISYFSGNRGTGKTTELNRLKKNLTDQGYEVFYIDLTDYLDQNEPPNLRQLLVYLALSFANEIDVNYGMDFRRQLPQARLMDWLRNTNVELTEAKVSLAAAGELKLNIRQGSNFSASLKEALQKHGDGWLSEAKIYMSQLAEAAKNKAKSSGVVVIYDSLERLRPSYGKEAEFYDQVAKLFGAYEHLRFPGVNAVYSVPPYLPTIIQTRNAVPLYQLGSVRVFEYSEIGERIIRPEGIALMIETVEKRFSNWHKFIHPETMELLAINSGGDMRAFWLRFLPAALHACYEADGQLPLSKDTQAVKDILTNERMSANSTLLGMHIPTLCKISEKTGVVVDTVEERVAAASLFEQYIAYTYNNGTTWVGASPLVDERIVEYRKKLAVKI